jgi:hypothetical protein
MQKRYRYSRIKGGVGEAFSLCSREEAKRRRFAYAETDDTLVKKAYQSLCSFA